MADLSTRRSEPTLDADAVIREYAPKVYNLARRMLGSESDAEDVTQEVLLTIFRKLPTFRGESSLSTWLHRITVNAALGYRRKRAHRAQHEVHDPLEEWTDEGYRHGQVRPWSRAADAAVLDRETQALIENAIAELPDVYRDVYLLADIEGLPNAEIADMLELSVPAVKSRLHRARMLMRDALAPHFEENRS